ILLSMMATAGCSYQKKDASMNIAVICKNKRDQYWDSVWKACDDAEEEMDISIMRLAPDVENVDDQISMINQAISANVDAIVLAAIDTDSENEVLYNATNAGIPILTIDSDVSYEGRVSYIGTQNLSAAAIVARYTKDLLNNDGKVGIIYHGATLTADLRKTGFTEELNPSGDVSSTMPAGAGSKHNNSSSQSEEKNSESESESTNNIKIIDLCDGEGDMEISKDMAKKLITEQHVNLIYTTNQPGTRGACEAISELIEAGTIQPNEVQLVGFDYFDGAYNYVTSGVLDAVIVQNPYNMGYLGIRSARNIVNGEEVPSLVDTGAILVTADNIDQADVQFLINSSDE
ncbi:MAG: substrate-binding domain-containing protein, partial [Oscillospiraceae bacterium]|nr:substrate-binding domain-containing protein [Oscillospiraceae bacterium]